MKILCFHPALAPYRVDFFNLLGEIADLKIVFMQDNLQNQRFDQKAMLSQLRVLYAHQTDGISLFGRSFRFGILRIIREESPDVILSYEASLITFELLALKKVGVIKADVWTSMDDSPDQVKRRTGLRRFARNYVVRSVARVIVPSHVAVRTYCEILPSVSQGKFSVVPIIHDVEAIRKNAPSVYASGREWRLMNCPKRWSRVIVFVGRLAEVKNLEWLIERVPEMPKTDGLVFVGDGPSGEALKAKVVDMQLQDRVLFAGRKEGDELYSMMAMADALVLCSHSETFGAVVAEAMQWGTPCVVARHLGASVLIEDGVNGVLFKSGNAKSFLDAIANVPSRTFMPILTINLKDAIIKLVNG